LHRAEIERLAREVQEEFALANTGASTGLEQTGEADRKIQDESSVTTIKQEEGSEPMEKETGKQEDAVRIVSKAMTNIKCI
jgi:hypothetical protein